MKWLLLILFVALVACNTGKPDDNREDSIVNPDSPVVPPNPVDSSKVYSNERFKEVTVRKTGENQYRVQGKAQVFEAAFSWVVEDGHEELKQGHDMTDAGAPEFGNFSFEFEVKKQRDNSVLHLILFEISAKDGSRTHELPIPLP